MISLQSHNQVLYHLTQLTSAVIPRQSSYTDRVKKCNESSIAKTDVLCQNSLVEAAKNCTELSAEMINLQNLKIPFQVKENYRREILEQIFEGKNYKWKVSYVSGLNFAENKRGFPCSQLSEPIILPAIYFSGKDRYRLVHNLCMTTSFGYNTQVRGFKTDRSIKVELERNPTLSTRLQKWITFSTPAHQIDKMSGTQAESENLRNLLNDNEIPANEQQRVKLAFAEGYMTGRKQKPLNFFFKLLKTLQTLTVIFVFLCCGFGLLGMYKSLSTGKFFKFHIGSHVEVNPEEINVTFDDVKGAYEAKQELIEIVEFLKNPNKFSVLGGKLPKGVLLIGVPGTGKTLLARAVAGEAGVPFFHVAGPEFDEILVGQGARRIRDLFKAAKRRAPCVIFIDEIDSVGAKRTNSVLHPYANQTINQLLSEMDGFRQNEGVIVLGATNRRDDLDKALLRPGRFDVEVHLMRPDIVSRKEILNLYLGKILTRDIDVDSLARSTTGFTGADIENMVNQAALRAAIDGADYVTMQHLEYAKDKMLLGPERKLRVPDEETTLITAYHEGGHALVGCLTKGGDPLHKVTIISRGPSLGQTLYVPEKDRYHVSKSYLLAKMDMMMGGRAAEELIFGPEKVTVGAASDFQAATGIAEAMVKQYGMSERIGFRTYPSSESGSSENNSHTNELIDNEMKLILQESYERAKAILKAHPKELKELAEALIKYETLDLEDVKAILNGKKIRIESVGNKTQIIDVPKNVM